MERNKLSEFEQVFGNLDHLETYEEKLISCLATIRDMDDNILDQFINPNSLASEPLCVLLGIYEAMQLLIKYKNGYVIAANFGDQECDECFKNEDGSLMIFSDIDEAIEINDRLYGSIIKL